MPRGADMVIDVRFLKNPHWDPALRPLDGRDAGVRAFVESDPAYAPFYARLSDLLTFLLPAYRAEGKSYFGLGLGCTGGRHRPSRWWNCWRKRLQTTDGEVSIRHRDLERGTGVSVADLGMGVA